MYGMTRGPTIHNYKHKPKQNKTKQNKNTNKNKTKTKNQKPKTKNQKPKTKNKNNKKQKISFFVVRLMGISNRHYSQSLYTNDIYII